MAFDIEEMTLEDLNQFKVSSNIDVYWLPDKICLLFYRDIKCWVGLASLSANPRKVVVGVRSAILSSLSFY